MATQIVMDHTGHLCHEFDLDDIEELAKAEKRFRELTSKGFTAAVRTAAGESVRILSFNPTARETLFFRRLIGG